MTSPEDASLPFDSGWKRIGQSWLAMKPWVKIWLFFLNAVFLAGLAFWEHPIARWSLVAYLASGPLLFGMMWVQGGLTRLLGLAHLIPWVPLVVYLTIRLSSNLWGPRILFAETPGLATWVLLLLASVALCLAFDAYDLVRWWRGERFVIGSPEAARRGASRRAPDLRRAK